jgi:hypothetical protein
VIEYFPEFAKRPRIISARETEVILNQSPKSRDRLVAEGRLQVFQIGTQKHGHLSTEVLRLQARV